jgi:hypothetical protein
MLDGPSRKTHYAQLMISDFQIECLFINFYSFVVQFRSSMRHSNRRWTKASTDKSLRRCMLRILAEPALAASSLWKLREFSTGRNVAWISSIGGRSRRRHCWKQATTHHPGAPATGTNILVDKIVDDHVDKS